MTVPNTPTLANLNSPEPIFLDLPLLFLAKMSSVIFSSHSVVLEVKASQGGVWKFPIRFQATEPPVDDLINIEATGLNKESSIGFRLTSQNK